MQGGTEVGERDGARPWWVVSRPRWAVSAARVTEGVVPAMSMVVSKLGFPIITGHHDGEFEGIIRGKEDMVEAIGHIKFGQEQGASAGSAWRISQRSRGRVLPNCITSCGRSGTVWSFMPNQV